MKTRFTNFKKIQASLFALFILIFLGAVFSGTDFSKPDNSAHEKLIYKDFQNLNELSLKERLCGTVEYNRMLEKREPSIKKNRELIEKFISSYKHEGRSVITIPVVVHIIHNLAVQNISDAQILSQMVVLNDDYRRLNADTTQTPAPFKPLGADCQINFCLAQRDPDGNPTNGITRTFTSKTFFVAAGDSMKFTALGGRDIWDRNRYCNIWVCNLGGGLLGYSQFPGGPASTDGNVIGYLYFGTIGTVIPPYDKGRTSTHEIGHWFNLFHIWGDEPDCTQDDLVDDTPLQGTFSSGCPTFPETDACSPVFPGIMFMNYLDYSDDDCMNIFTHGQSVRMNAALAGPRNSLVTSNGCVPIGIKPISSEIPANFHLYDNYPNPFNPGTKIRFNLPKAQNVKIAVYNIEGKEISVIVNRYLNAGKYEVDFNGSGLSSGVYFYSIITGEFVDTKPMMLIK